MIETARDRVVPKDAKRVALLLLHCAQFAFALIVLGLDAYGIYHIAYAILIFSLIVVSVSFSWC